MSITEKSIKLLWSNAAGRCSFPGCDKRLSVEQASDIAPHTLGEMAHIKGKNRGSNRYDANQTNDERDSYQNLILLCPNHHTEIDKPENEIRFPIGWLLEAKKAHEQWIITSLDREKIESIDQLKGAIAALLTDNHQAWQKYGPKSLLAMQNPNSDKLYALWTQERLTTIAPNNRAIAKLLTTHRFLFPAQQQPIVSRFISHAASYEHWINDELPYQAVERFPNDFDSLILG
nr:HNH endonuclease [Alcaligenes faecalis]